MSMNLILTFGKDESFPLAQTPTEVTREMIKKTQQGSKSVREAYLDWYGGMYLKEKHKDHYTYVEQYAAFLEHKCALLEWLLDHPNHTWGAF